MRIKLLVTLTLLLLLVLPAHAQDATLDAPGNFPISYDEVVNQTITNGGFFDTWRLSASAGDIIVVYMRASDGLAPFVVILDPGSDVVASSVAGAVNGEVNVEWTVEAAGIYTINATRVDVEFGTTTGSYELEVRNANPQAGIVDPYSGAVFQCQTFEAANLLSIDFADDVDQASSYRISVYGLDGLQPVINLFIPTENLSDCSRDGRYMGGDTLALPNDIAHVVPESEGNNAARLTITGAEQAGNINILIGSAFRSVGRFVVVIEGLQIGANDTDTFYLRSGPFMAESPLLVYMMRAPNSRLDSFMQSFRGDGSLATCDDAGRRTCPAEVPSLRDSSLMFTDGTPLIGSRFDAGLLLVPQLNQQIPVTFGSFQNRTTGGYAIVVIGQFVSTAS